MDASRARIVRQAAAGTLLVGLLALALGVTGSARLERADFVMNNGAEVQSLDPAVVSGVPEGRVANALYEGLTVQARREVEGKPHRFLGEILVDLGYLSERKVLEILGILHRDERSPVEGH